METHDVLNAFPLQDVDLLNRLSQYFDTLDQHVRAGHGWFIFNATGSRGSRVASYISSRLSEFPPVLSYYAIPWRDFSLNAYMVEVELQSITDGDQLKGKAKAEFDIATRVSRDSMVRMIASDLLILTGVRPAHPHELSFLDQTIERRYHGRLPTILVTPLQPQEMAAHIQGIAPDWPFWDRLFGRMYERSLMAL